MSQVYIVIAYRYGWTNGSWFIVWGGADEESAVNAAIAENATSGHKSGCAVYEIEGSEEKLVHYCPSGWGEEEPRFCALEQLWKQVGSWVMDKESEGGDIGADELKAAVVLQKRIINAMHPNSFKEVEDSTKKGGG